MNTLSIKIRHGLNDYWSTYTVGYKNNRYAFRNYSDGPQLYRFNSSNEPVIKFNYKFESILRHGKNNIEIPIDFPQCERLIKSPKIKYFRQGGYYDVVQSYIWHKNDNEPIHAKTTLMNSGTLVVPDLTYGLLIPTPNQTLVIKALDVYNLAE